jgi:MscS family membrane protein
MDELRSRLGASGSAWVEGVGVLLIAVALGWLVGRLLHRALALAAHKSPMEWDDRLLPQLRRPMALVPAVVAGWIALPALPLATAAARITRSGLSILTTLVVIWLAFRAVEVVRGVLATRPWAADRPATLSLLAMAARVAKLLVVVLAVITTLAALGVPVASLVAGLGIGGLAVALAAQKTIANLFGALSIGVDRPFREGDSVKIGDVEGTVEAIGLRSTRIRTAARTVVTIPNAELADTRTESMTACDRTLFAQTIPLAYGTPHATVLEILGAVEAHLRAQPEVWPERLRVHLAALAPSAIEVRVQCWFTTTDGDAVARLRQDNLLTILRLLEAARATFALPAQTVHLAPGRGDHSAAKSASIVG